MSTVPNIPGEHVTVVLCNFANEFAQLTQVEEVAFGCLDSTEMTMAFRLHRTTRAYDDVKSML